MDFATARQHMVDSQVRTSDVTDFALQAAMRATPRERLCAPARAFAAYAEAEVEIAPGRKLMAAREVGKLLQALRPRRGEQALAIAAPYAAAVMARMGLAVTAQEEDARAATVLADGLAAEGVRLETAPLAQPVGGGWDLIVSEGAVAELPPAWLDALKVGGRLAVVERDGPVGQARLYVRTGAGQSSRRELFDAAPSLLAGFERAAAFEF